MAVVVLYDEMLFAFDEFLYKQDAEAREYYKFITKYYNVCNYWIF